MGNKLNFIAHEKVTHTTFYFHIPEFIRSRLHVCRKNFLLRH